MMRPDAPAIERVLDRGRVLRGTGDKRGVDARAANGPVRSAASCGIAALAVAPLTPVPVASASPGQAASVRLAAGRATAEADSAQSAAASPSWPSKTKGRLVVVFRAPAGVPAGLRVAGERQAVVTRPASGHTARVVLPPGRYRLAADAATVSGRTYQRSSAPAACASSRARRSR